MRLVLLSDTHTMHNQVKVPDGDVLVFAGDATFTGKRDQWVEFLYWLRRLPHEHKVFIAGNHDFNSNHFCTTNEYFTYLDNSGTEIDGVKFWGSPITPTFGMWAHMADRGEAIRKHWDAIPNDTDVLITHGPPYGFLDQVAPHLNTEHLGCEDLRNAVWRIQPRIHIFGHIHGGYGEHIFGGTYFCNASVVNEAYRVVNSPRIVEERSYFIKKITTGEQK